ncbi:Hypothetical predicted protein [Cloeon dipterum]|uniref:Uncharacterized protein n=1 Tax=Cloeon dipterum TaxID=197152 RepID=A0A8S1CFQ2_9INSE|nr:Hypothetical predicted protein [Cloeon dipterum]
MSGINFFDELLRGLCSCITLRPNGDADAICMVCTSPFDFIQFVTSCNDPLSNSELEAVPALCLEHGKEEFKNVNARNRHLICPDCMIRLREAVQDCSLHQ